MGNILNDILEEVNIKPNKNKLVLKWVISIAGGLITIAFVFGQFKASFFNRMDKFETTVNRNTVAINELKYEMSARFVKIYEDGYSIFDDFQEYNNKQLTLIVDYGSTNKDLLKRVLEVNSIEKNKNIENQIQSAMNENVSGTAEPQTMEYVNLIKIMPNNSKDTTFIVKGATENFVNKIDINRYEIVKRITNVDNPMLIDISYKNR